MIGGKRLPEIETTAVVARTEIGRRVERGARVVTEIGVSRRRVADEKFDLRGLTEKGFRSASSAVEKLLARTVGNRPEDQPVTGLCRLQVETAMGSPSPRAGTVSRIAVLEER